MIITLAHHSHTHFHTLTPSHAHVNRYLLILLATDTVIDTFGMLGPDPGSSWTVCGDTTATQDHTLVRKPTVITGM